MRTRARKAWDGKGMEMERPGATNVVQRRGRNSGNWLPEGSGRGSAYLGRAAGRRSERKLSEPYRRNSETDTFRRFRTSPFSSSQIGLFPNSKSTSRTTPLLSLVTVPKVTDKDLTLVTTESTLSSVFVRVESHGSRLKKMDG